MSTSPNESELADATEYLKSPEFQRDNSPHSYKQVCTVLAALASAQRDSARLDALLGLFGPDMGITPDGVHVYSTEDFVDMDKWLSEGGNCDSPELRRAFREAIDSAMKAPTL